MDASFGTATPEGPWDYIFIGSGIGSMATAAVLARMGRRCLLLEQHYVPGGFTHTFKRKGWTWDVGVHAVGEVTRHSMTGRLLEDLTAGGLSWASLGSPYERFHFPDGVSVEFPDTPEAFRGALVTAFPEEAAVIDLYLAKVREAAGQMRGFFLSRAVPPRLGRLTDRVLGRRGRRWLQRTTAEVLDEIGPSTRLRAVLLGQWGYYGTAPSQSPFGLHALVVRHYLHGAFYPVGGSGRIASSLLSTVQKAGGYTRIKASVEQIIIEGGRAVGVRLSDGEEVRAPRIVSGAGALNTVNALLPPEAAQAPWARSIALLSPSPAHVCLHLGFRGDIAAAGATRSNQWFYFSWDSEHTTWQGSGQPPCLFLSFPSLRDAAHEPGEERLHTGEVVTFVPRGDYDRWNGTRWMKRGADYEAFKQEVTDRMLALVFERLPGLKPLLAHAELSTPLSTEHFNRTPQGSIYGLEVTPARYKNRYLRARTPIPGLFLTGADVASPGVMGAFMGGVLCALSAEPVGALRYLKEVVRR